MAQSRIEYATLLADVDSGTENNWLGQTCGELSTKQGSMHHMANLAGVRSFQILVVMPEFGGRQGQENRNRQAGDQSPVNIRAK